MWLLISILIVWVIWRFIRISPPEFDWDRPVNDWPDDDWPPK